MRLQQRLPEREKVQLKSKVEWLLKAETVLGGKGNGMVFNEFLSNLPFSTATKNMIKRGLDSHTIERFLRTGDAEWRRMGMGPYSMRQLEFVSFLREEIDIPETKSAALSIITHNGNGHHHV